MTDEQVRNVGGIQRAIKKADEARVVEFLAGREGQRVTVSVGVLLALYRLAKSTREVDEQIEFLALAILGVASDAESAAYWRGRD